jgi:hypothetical protein
MSRLNAGILRLHANENRSHIPALPFSSPQHERPALAARAGDRNFFLSSLFFMA